MKKLILGLVIGLMLGMSTNAFAAIGDKVQAVFAEFNYVVNGKSKTLDAPVLVYEGTSYVRTTQIANLLGFDVTYKADSRTIEFDNPKPTPVQTSAPNEQIDTPIQTDGLTPTADNTTQPSNNVESPTPSPEATPLVTASPTPAPSNLVACKAIRDDYSYKIVMVGYEGGAEGPKRQKILVLEYERDQKLSAAGCN